MAWLVSRETGKAGVDGRGGRRGARFGPGQSRSRLGRRWCCRPGISPTPSCVRAEGAGLLPQPTDRPPMNAVERRLLADVCRRLSVRTGFPGATCGSVVGVGTQTRWPPVGGVNGPAANVEFLLGWPSWTFHAPGCCPQQPHTSTGTFHVERASLRIAAVGLTLQRYSSSASGLAGRAFRLGSQLGRDTDRESDGHCFSIKLLSRPAPTGRGVRVSRGTALLINRTARSTGPVDSSPDPLPKSFIGSTFGRRADQTGSSRAGILSP